MQGHSFIAGVRNKGAASGLWVFIALLALNSGQLSQAGGKTVSTPEDAENEENKSSTKPVGENWNQLDCRNTKEAACYDTYGKKVADLNAEYTAAEAQTKEWKSESLTTIASYLTDRAKSRDERIKAAADQRDQCKIVAITSCTSAKKDADFGETVANRKDLIKAEDGDCKSSDVLMGNGGCGLTNTVRDVGKGTAAGADMLGSTLVNLTGSHQTTTLSQQTDSGNSVMRDSMRGAASTYEDSAKSETISAYTNAAAGAVMAWRSSQHLIFNKAELRKNEALEKNGLITQKTKNEHFAQYNHAQKEQSAKGGEAMVEAAGFAAKAGQKFIAAGLYRNQAKNLRKLAGAMDDDYLTTTTDATPVPEATPTLPSFSWATPIPSTTGTENQAAKDTGSDFTTDLGPPFDPNTDTKDPEGPPANPYQAGGAPPGSVAGGSGAPGLGGGGGGAGAKDSEEGARLADGGKSITYGQTGGGYTTGARAPSGTSPDLSGLLAQFLPKEEDKKGQNGILDFGGRAPSAGGGDGPLLGPKENIFDRVSKQYQQQLLKKRVGI